MNLAGLRVQIAGSAASGTEPSTLTNSHAFIGELVQHLIHCGAGLVLSCGAEPICDGGLPGVFDWTALSILSEVPDPGPKWPSANRKRFIVSTSQNSLTKIPSTRIVTWDKCSARSDFELETIEPGWRFGGALRSQQEALGDVLVILGGGTGVEHLAELYRSEGKPVIPIGGNIRGNTDVGHGGSSYIYRQALFRAKEFFSLIGSAGGAAARLQTLRIDGSTDCRKLASNVIALICGLLPPVAFYVRLIDADSCRFDAVERFFQEIIEPIVIEKGFTPHQVGRDRPVAAFLNVEIFEVLHRCGLVVADLTDVRPNCMMELGYALGRRRRVVVSAMYGTELPFDQDKISTYFWRDNQPIADCRVAYSNHLDLALDTPPLFKSVNSNEPIRQTANLVLASGGARFQHTYCYRQATGNESVRLIR